MVGTLELRTSSLLTHLFQDRDPFSGAPQLAPQDLPPELADGIDSQAELRQLTEMLDRTGGDQNGLPRVDLASFRGITGQDQVQMLIDWIQSGGPEANKKIEQPRPIGNLSSPASYSPQPASWNGAADVSSTGGSSGGGSVVPTGSTGGTAPDAAGGPPKTSEPQGGKSETFEDRGAQTAAFIDQRLDQGGVGEDMVAAGKKHDVDPLILASMSENDAKGGDSLEGPTMIDEIASPREKIFEDAKLFADLREQGGASKDDPIEEQLRAVNSARGTNQDDWLQGVSDRYQDITPAAKTFAKQNPVADTSSVQGLAKLLLESDNVSFWDGLSTGSDEKMLEQIAETGKSYVPATGETVAPNENMMRALYEMSKQGPIMINALTGGEHSTGSNHYSGTAVDLDIGVGDAAQIEAIANQHGGTRNSETDHIHLDF